VDSLPLLPSSHLFSLSSGENEQPIFTVSKSNRI
jgi:hypothetical protein